MARFMFCDLLKNQSEPNFQRVDYGLIGKVSVGGYIRQSIVKNQTHRQ
jgi:hypothetical protein